MDFPTVKRERRLVRRDWGAWLSLARRSKPSAHPLDESRHSNLSTHSQTLTPSGFPNGATCTDRRANAAPRHQCHRFEVPASSRELVQGTSKSKSGIKIIDFLVPPSLRNSFHLRFIPNSAN